MASAGVLLSAGLFGMYLGNPRLQRAYATTPCIDPSATPTPVTNETDLNIALQGAATCIEIQGTIGLAADIQPLSYTNWGTDRETYGLTIFGSGDDAIDGNAHGGLKIVLAPNAGTYEPKLHISDLTLTDFQTGNGSALYMRSRQITGAMEVTLDAVTLSYNTAGFYGGAAYLGSNGAPLTVNVSNSTFDNNTSGRKGGALYAYSPDTTTNVCGSTFASNTASGYGGAISMNGTVSDQIYVTHGSACGGLVASSFTGNSADDNGGAIFTKGEAHVTGGAVFANNQAMPYGLGGAIKANFVEVTTDTFGSAEFTANSAYTGGALYAYSGADIDGALLTGNYASYAAGAVYVNTHPLTVTNSTVMSNTASQGRGGGLFSRGVTVIESSAILSNSAYGKGGGVYFSGSDAHTITNSFIGYNSAPYGGGVSAPSGPVTLLFSTVYANVSTLGGANATEIAAQDLTLTASAVGSSSSTILFTVSGTLTDSYSVATTNGTPLAGTGSGNVATGGLALNALDGTDPGQPGRIPGATSVLGLSTSGGGYAPSTNPVPSVTTDQLGATRSAPFTIGSRQWASTAVAPVVSSVTPNTGPSSGGTSVTVTGTGFTGATAVTFDGTAATSFTVVNDTTITATSPAGAAGPADIAVTTVGGTGTLPAAFTYQSASIAITGSRSTSNNRYISVVGSTSGLVGQQVVPHVKLQGERDYSIGTGVKTVNAQGVFTWERRTSRKAYVYFSSGGVRSPRVIVAAR